MKCFKIILSYILGIILFLTLNLMGVLLIIKNTFNETTLTNIVDNINIYDIVIGKLESLGDYDSNSTIDDIFKKIGNESNISSNVVESVMEDKNVKSTLNDSTKDILLNSYKNVEQKINSDKIQNSINQAFVKYEEKTGTNIENDLKEKFNQKINTYITKVENKLKNINANTLLGNKLYINESNVNKAILILSIISFINIILIIFINKNKVTLLNISIPLLGTSAIGLFISLVRFIVLKKLTLNSGMIQGIIYSIFKYSFNYIFNFSICILIISIILTVIYYIIKNKD